MIVFNEGNHTYYNVDTQEYYTPVSTIISKYKEKFVATPQNTYKTQIKLGLTHQQVIEYWKEINTKSIIRGNRIHKEIECYLLTRISNNVEEVPYEYLDKLLRKRANIHIEKLVYDHNNKIAGTPDIVVEYKNYLQVVDWKTNEKDLHSNYKNKTLLPPYDYLLDCSYSIYLLQAYYYNKMLEAIYNKPVKKNILIHIWNEYDKGYKEINITNDLKQIK